MKYEKGRGRVKAKIRRKSGYSSQTENNDSNQSLLVTCGSFCACVIVILVVFWTLGVIIYRTRKAEVGNKSIFSSIKLATKEGLISFLFSTQTQLRRLPSRI